MIHSAPRLHGEGISHVRQHQAVELQIFGAPEQASDATGAMMQMWLMMRM
jgi:hypothetical protein